MSGKQSTGKDSVKYTTQKDILDEVAKEFGITVDKVEFLVKDLSNSLRHYLTHPLEARGGILLEKSFKFTINDRLLRFHIYKELSKPDEDINFEKLDDLTEILDQFFEYEQKAKRKKNVQEK